MIFPGIFSNRFPSRRLIRSNEQVSIWQVADALARTYIVKTTPINRRPALEVLEALESLQDLNVVGPIECHPEGQWCHQLLPHFPLGSLDDLLKQSGTLLSDDCVELVRQLGHVFARLHVLGAGKSIVHRDIKPSNILLGQDRQGRRLYFLADFDAAVLLKGSPVADSQSTRRFTLRYAAPEVVGAGTLSAAADCWSLGILLLECLTGRHPLDSDLGQLPNNSVRTLLSSDWHPTLTKVDQYWRALLGGLLDRDPFTRWGHEKIHRWLGHDSAVISDGLTKAGESAASTPFLVGSTPTYSSQALAEALLTQWEVIQ